jgi:hypothetical protein
MTYASGWGEGQDRFSFQERRESETRFGPARITDNAYNNPKYRKVLEALHGWQRQAWLSGEWDLAAESASG